MMQKSADPEQPTDPALSGLPVIDLPALVEKLSSNRQMIARCHELFTIDSAQAVTTIRRGMAEDDARAARKAVHGLRGMLVTLEMRRPARTAELLESMCNGSNFREAIIALRLLEDEMNAASFEIARFLAEGQ